MEPSESRPPATWTGTDWASPSTRSPSRRRDCFSRKNSHKHPDWKQRALGRATHPPAAFYANHKRDLPVFQRVQEIAAGKFAVGHKRLDLLRRDGDEWIDWTWPSRRIYNLIRAIAPPGPGARTLLGDQAVAILESERIPQAPRYRDRPGTVVGRDENGIVVKTGDRTLRVTQVAHPIDGALEDKRTPSYRIGTTFGVNRMDEITRLRRRISELEARLGNGS